MIADSPFSRRRGRSGCGPEHQRRQDVPRYWLQRALDETPFTLDDFAEALAANYCGQVPTHARRLAFEALSTQQPHREYAALLTRMRKTVQRYMDPEGLHMPVEIEEAWVTALPAPYRDHCRHELVWRLGCMGVDRAAPAPGPADDFRGLAALSSRAADVIDRVSQMLADGQLGPEDRDMAPEALMACRETAAQLLGLADRIEKATAPRHLEAVR